MNRRAEFKSHNVNTQVNQSLVGLFVAVGVANGAIAGCTQETSPLLDDYPDFSYIYVELLTNITNYDDQGGVEYHLCLWANDVERYHWTLTTPDSLTSSSKACRNFALAIYDGVRWFVISNSDTGDRLSNFSSVNEYSTSCIEEFSVDHLVFGTKSALLKFNDNFDAYATNAQQKVLHLCDELDDITDTITYRKTRQYLCIWCRVYNYDYLGANNSDHNLTEWSVADKAELNQVAFLCHFHQCVDYTLLLLNFAIVLFVCLYTIVAVIYVVGIYGTVGWELGKIQVAVPTVVGSIDYALHSFKLW